MNILDNIVASKREEVALGKASLPLAALIEEDAYHAPCIPVKKRISGGGITPVIAEFKRRSPSKGWIHEQADPEAIAKGYAAGNAAAISVLTDGPFFGGSNADLLMVKAAVPEVPVLRKDFTIDAWQLHEAKALGADIILLIAAILSPAQAQDLAAEAKGIGLQVLLELHTEDELAHICDFVDMVGINNRNLKNFAVDIAHSIRLQQMLPAHILRVAESGIHSAEVGATLLQSGFDLLLMGEYFMKQPNTPIAFASFASQLKQLTHEG